MLPRGKRVRVTYQNRTIEAEVILGSDNRRSLMLRFDAMLGGFVGMMPVLQHEDGTYRDLVERLEVGIEWLDGPPS